MPSAKRFLLVTLFWLAATASAFCQSPQYPQTICGGCVIGRLGTQPGPSEQIPFSVLTAQIFGAVEPANTVYAGPSSGGNAGPSFRALVGADLPLPSSSTLGGVKSNTCATSNWLSSLSTSGVLSCAQPSFSDLLGSIAPAQIPTPTASLLGGVKAKAAVTHQYLNAIGTDGGPTSAQPACADLSDATGNCNAAAGQLPATATNDNASAGKVGEEIESVVAFGSAVSLSTGTSANMTSITLTPGDWDVTSSIQFQTGTSTSVTRIVVGLSLTSATFDTTNGRISSIFTPATVPGATNAAYGLGVGPLRFSVSTNTTVFAVAQGNFTVAGFNAYGVLRARRMR